MYETADELDLYVTERLNQRLTERGETRTDLASRASSRTGLKRTTLVNDLSYVLTGSLDAWTGRLRAHADPKAKLRKLGTLAIFMDELGIETDDPLVKRVRERYSDFVYPPLNRE